MEIHKIIPSSEIIPPDGGRDMDDVGNDLVSNRLILDTDSSRIKRRITECEGSGSELAKRGSMSETLIQRYEGEGEECLGWKKALLEFMGLQKNKNKKEQWRSTSEHESDFSLRRRSLVLRQGFCWQLHLHREGTRGAADALWLSLEGLLVGNGRGVPCYRIIFLIFSTAVCTRLRTQVLKHLLYHPHHVYLLFVSCQ